MGAFFPIKGRQFKSVSGPEGALLRRAGRQESIFHKSIMEYFVALLLYQETVAHADEPWEESSFLNKKLVKTEPSIVRFLVNLTQGKHQETANAVEGGAGNQRPSALN